MESNLTLKKLIISLFITTQKFAGKIKLQEDFTYIKRFAVKTLLN